MKFPVAPDRTGLGRKAATLPLSPQTESRMDPEKAASDAGRAGVPGRGALRTAVPADGPGDALSKRQHLRLPPPPAGLVEKLELLAAEGAPPPIDLIFIGSSRTHFNFKPSSFDAESRRLGLSVRSFNLGLPGAGGHEIDYAIEHFVLDQPRLRYVFIEFPTFEYQIADQDERTYRKIYWHDAKRTLDAVRTSLASPLPMGLRWAEAQDHGVHFLLRSCAPWPAPGRTPVLWEDDGYESWEHGSVAPSACPPGPRTLEIGDYVINRPAVLRLQNLLEDRGIEAYFVIPPGAPNLAPLLEMRARGEIRLFKLNDPSDYPVLFRRDTNAGYLLAPGARHYSRILARRFAATRGNRVALGDERRTRTEAAKMARLRFD
jgi:hypothetical protein